jgi:glycosyltransferase involved in cell wall biosynthesis
MDKSGVFIIMPAYNAGATIEKVFKRIPPDFKNKVERYIVVDDGSIDNTQAVLDILCREFPNLTVLRHETNRGYGAAQKTLLSHSISQGARIAIVLHSDGQYSPEKLPEMLAPLETEAADLVQGSRMLEDGALKGGMPFYKYIGNKFLTSIENVCFGMKLAEYHSGYMAYSRKLLLSVPIDTLSDTFEFDLEMIVCTKILGFPMIEIAIPTIYAGEKSHLNPVKYGFDVLGVVNRYRRGYYHELLGKEAGK